MTRGVSGSRVRFSTGEADGASTGIAFCLGRAATFGLSCMLEVPRQKTWAFTGTGDATFGAAFGRSCRLGVPKETAGADDLSFAGTGDATTGIAFCLGVAGDATFGATFGRSWRFGVPREKAGGGVDADLSFFATVGGVDIFCLFLFLLKNKFRIGLVSGLRVNEN